jgi:hypothetical protein
METTCGFKISLTLQKLEPMPQIKLVHQIKLSQVVNKTKRLKAIKLSRIKLLQMKHSHPQMKLELQTKLY